MSRKTKECSSCGEAFAETFWSFGWLPWSDGNAECLACRRRQKAGLLQEFLEAFDDIF